MEKEIQNKDMHVAIGRPDRRRRGAATVEFALVAVIVFTFVLACFELCRGMMVVQSLEEAARSGCRVAILQDATTEDVQLAVEAITEASAISSAEIEIEPTALDGEQWDPVIVRVSVGFDEVSWVPLPNFLASKTYSASCVLLKEGGAP